MIDVEEYLQLEAAGHDKHEYVAGDIFAMSGASLRHNAVCGNLYKAISSHLEGKPCRAFMSDVKVRLQAGREEIFYYPDVMVACGKIDMEGHYLRDPKLVIEVLSPSTETIDRREKAMHYRQAESMEEYVLVAQDRYEVRISRRREDWTPVVLNSPEAVAELRSIELSLPLERIYRGVIDLTMSLT